MLHRRTLLSSLATGAGVAALAPFSRAMPPAPVAPYRPFIEAGDGARLHYEDWGSGPPIVFVAPWALDSTWWEYQVAGLVSKGVRCVVFDRRGHGRSDRPGRGYEFDTLADDIAAVLTQLDLEAVTLVGHSMGCAEVVRYVARSRGARVARIALIGTITPFLLKTDDNPTGFDASLLERGRADLARDRPHQIAKAADTFFGAPANPVSTEVKEWWTRMMVDRCSLVTMLELHRAFTTTDFRPDLRQIVVPALVIHGERDVTSSPERNGRRTAELIARSEFRTYEGAAHGLPVTHAERLNGDLLAYATG